MSDCPRVDINLFAFNGAETIGDAIDSVLAQTWPNFRLTVIDDGSTDDTLRIACRRAANDSRISVLCHHGNLGAIASFQHAFWHGDADFVMPKSADDLIAADFVARLMDVLLRHPACAMCHATGLVFAAPADASFPYPPEHALQATGPDPVSRARHVMRRYTSSPSFWGIYRRNAAARLAPIAYRAGWDHVVLAELALYGEIRHIPDRLFRRRDGGKPVLHLARAATPQARTRLPAEDALGDPRWRMPYISTAYEHLEAFATVALPLEQRRALLDSVPQIFRERWLAAMIEEAALFAEELPALATSAAALGGAAAGLALARLRAAAEASHALVPEVRLPIETLVEPLSRLTRKAA